MINKNNIVKIILPEDEIPKFWYNIKADMPDIPEPYYNPRTLKPLTTDDLCSLFPKEIAAQEFSNERYIEIPEEIRQLYRSFRPSPLYRARQLEKSLGTTARIYYKYEGGNATGSHKLNSALAQAYYNKKEGINRLTTETGAGQWGCAISMATKHFGLECTVYMVKVSYKQKPYRKNLMHTFGAKVYASPSSVTKSGRDVLSRDPDSTGSLGIAVSEAVEDALSSKDTNYSLGSLLDHVCLHQTVIGIESKKQLEIIDEYPDIVFACCGGGSNFAGMCFPFIKDKMAGRNIRLVAVEPNACPTLTKGVYAFDYGDLAKIAPIGKMYTLGHNFIPSGIHSGGLRYHGASVLVSKLYNQNLIEAMSYSQNEVFRAAILFSQTEGIVPAPESSHAIKAAIDHAIYCRESGKSEVILISLSGNGYFDMSAYESFISGEMLNTKIDESDIKKSLQSLPEI